MIQVMKFNMKADKNIEQLVKAYESNPSVFNLKSVEKLVQNNCQVSFIFDMIENQQMRSSIVPTTAVCQS